jgi:hypothetical protein
MCIYFLYQEIKNTNDMMVYSTFNFWVIITFLIYFAGTFFLYIMTENMRYSQQFQKLYLIINISFNILKNILLSVAMCMKITRRKSVTSIISIPDDDLFLKQN